MNFELKTLSLAQAAATACDALVLLWPDQPVVAKGDPLAELARREAAGAHWEGGVAKLWLSQGHPACKAARLVMVRAGDGSPASVRRAVAAALGALKSPAVKKVVLSLAVLAPVPGVLRAAMTAAADATYAYTATKSKPTPRALQTLLLGVADAAAVRADHAQGAALVKGIELAKEWANRPGNHATPSMLADVARKLGKSPRIQTEVLGPREVAKLGMGAFMAVAQGSEEPLRFIVMRYQGAAKTDAPVVLVGKGITFDTGGISLKPAPEMDEMKFDMGGAASVLGLFAALAEAQPKVNVVGLIPTCENMPDGRAIKPGDVVTSMSGQTIEILNTDAEGRLILCDALTYAQRFKPRAVIDIATLTGACVIALGGVRSGLFATDDALAQALATAGEEAQDPCWRMPLDDEYAEGLKTNFADMANVAGRQAGAVTAAKFLQKFVGDAPWAHLDIAGTAWKSGAAKGATGRPVGLLFSYLTQVAAAPVPAARKAPRKPATPRAGA
ncbi:leucyl aminopeptidase [Hydrogenophaga sp. OTU3427]|uniref:leucyl aminopeptidase n=1 Tax=Hydrogenophaga sp. OTU3427 TaxID=3043856 RepID=UPI00313C4ED5